MSLFKVNINDKLQKIVEIMSIDGLNGYYMHQGKYLDKNALDESFVKHFIKD